MSDEPLSPADATRYYDRLRKRMQRYVERKGPRVARSAEYLLLVPDVFILLWRLVTDDRVTGRAKLLLGGGIAYYVLPLDIIPEALLGPLGYMDDLIVGVFVLNRILADTDPAILRAHWSGSDDVLAVIRRVLDQAETLVGNKMLERLKRVVR